MEGRQSVAKPEMPEFGTCLREERIVSACQICVSLERLVEADGGGAVEDDVDAAGEPLHVLRADGEAGLRQLAADGDDLPVEVGVVLPHPVEQLGEERQADKES